jgi:hypothetical protein
VRRPIRPAALSTSTPVRTSPPQVALLLALVAAWGCAHGRPPAPDVVAAARALSTYSAELRVGVSGAGLRGSVRALLAFARPDALRVEVPGPGGVRLLAVARGGTLWAVFPGEEAYFEGAARPEEMEALLGLALSPEEVMDVLVGRAPARLPAYEARWRDGLPQRIRATLPDGARLSVTVEAAEPRATLPAAAFDEPRHPGYRRLDAEEARALWGRRPRRRESAHAGPRVNVGAWEPASARRLLGSGARDHFARREP